MPHGGFRTPDGRAVRTVTADEMRAVDAVVGYGLAGAPRGRARDLVGTCNARAGTGVSLDVPSGWTRPAARRRASPSRRT